MRGPYPHPPRQPQRSSGAVIVCGVIGFLAFAFVGMVVLLQLLSGGGDGSSSGEPVTASSPSVGSPVSSPLAAAPTPFVTPTSLPSPPAPPEPPANAKENPLYSAGTLPRVNCPYHGSARPRSMGRFFKSKTDCLDKAWRQVFEDAGIPFEQVGRVYFTSPGQGPCGDYPDPSGRYLAYYCNYNATIYIGLNHVVKAEGADPTRYHYVYLSLLAHEYGHHLQNITGIAEGRYKLENRADSRAERLELSRRYELQASCFGGSFAGSIWRSYGLSPAQRDRMVQYEYTRGDSPGEVRNHGSEHNNGRWYEHGFEHRDPTYCQTFSADDKDVS